ncbi:MAG: hypothetical protein HQL99_15380 [Magnetococcales bacterium]|nr:hypothetical protein [Magnetococcales bacterium]
MNSKQITETDATFDPHPILTPRIGSVQPAQNPDIHGNPAPFLAFFIIFLPEHLPEITQKTIKRDENPPRIRRNPPKEVTLLLTYHFRQPINHIHISCSFSPPSFSQKDRQPTHNQNRIRNLEGGYPPPRTPAHNQKLPLEAGG